jgi:hypothetical protein
MSNAKSFADSIVLLTSQTGARDSGTRLLMLQKLVNECARGAGDDLTEQLAALDALNADLAVVLKNRTDIGDFLTDIADTVATKRRHIQDALAA